MIAPIPDQTCFLGSQKTRRLEKALGTLTTPFTADTVPSLPMRMSGFESQTETRQGMDEPLDLQTVSKMAQEDLIKDLLQRSSLCPGEMRQKRALDPPASVRMGGALRMAQEASCHQDHFQMALPWPFQKRTPKRRGRCDRPAESGFPGISLSWGLSCNHYVVGE